MTHVDLYGLFSSDDAKQSAIGSVHGVGEFGINTASFLSKVGWGLSTPVRAVSWMTGRSSLSQDWGAFQRSNAAFHAAGDRWMHRVLPGDPNNKYYGMFRGGVNDGLEMGTLFLGARSAYAMVDKTGTMIRGTMSGMQKVARPAGGGVSNFKKEVLRFHSSSGAENANAALNLNRKLSRLENFQQFANRTITLPDGRIRYYDTESISRIAGPTRGACNALEWNPKTGSVRGWYECHDHLGNINRVHPKNINGQIISSPYYPPINAELTR